VLSEVDELIKEGYAHVVDADLDSYFDSISKEPLMSEVSKRIRDRQSVGVDPCISELGHHRRNETMDTSGRTPQGAVISPLLANIYLHPLDRQMREKNCGPCVSESIPMRKLPTGESRVRENRTHGSEGRGRRKPFPAPYQADARG
jgi:retron-type reverse transcriptase